VSDLLAVAVILFVAGHPNASQRYSRFKDPPNLNPRGERFLRRRLMV
jgi:hypothetical protein